MSRPASLRQMLPLGKAEWAEAEAAMHPIRLANGEVFVREGDVARRVGVIEEGIVRYHVLRDGREHVTGFDAEGEVAGDFASFFEGSAAVHTIEAVGPCVLRVLTREAFDDLARRFPALAGVRSAVAETLWVGERVRAAEAQQLTAEERYRRLLERSPHLVQRVPLYHIASYLGVTPEALSRIRARI